MGTTIEKSIEAIFLSQVPELSPRASQVVDAACLQFEMCQRVDLVELAQICEVNRATLYRWFGSRDALLAEVLWRLSMRIIHSVIKGIPGTSLSGLMLNIQGYLKIVSTHKGQTHFVKNEPEVAARVLFTGEYSIRNRLINILLVYLPRYRAFKEGDPQVKTLAVAIVRLGETFLYGDRLGDTEPQLEEYFKIIALLMANVMN